MNNSEMDESLPTQQTSHPPFFCSPFMISYSPCFVTFGDRDREPEEQLRGKCFHERSYENTLPIKGLNVCKQSQRTVAGFISSVKKHYGSLLYANNNFIILLLAFISTVEGESCLEYTAAGSVI